MLSQDSYLHYWQNTKSYMLFVLIEISYSLEKILPADFSD